MLNRRTNGIDYFTWYFPYTETLLVQVLCDVGKHAFYYTDINEMDFVKDNFTICELTALSEKEVIDILLNEIDEGYSYDENVYLDFDKIKLIE